MTYPGYLLNPGDMFQVEIDRVLTATGQPRPPPAKGAPGREKALPSSEPEEEAEGEAEGPAEGETEAVSADAKSVSEHLKDLKKLARRAREILRTKDQDIKANRKRSLRQFIQTVKKTHDRRRASSSVSEIEMLDTEKELSLLLETLSLSGAEREARRAAVGREERLLEREQRKPEKNSDSSTTDSSTSAATEAASTANTTSTLSSSSSSTDKQSTTRKKGEILGPQERTILARLMLEEAENPHDASKPYATPWRPRDWMAPFAFIPRYLEVNQRICAAVYLRHPVARPGSAEVPSPYPQVINQLAFNWYLRRR
jgi:hypothetical protein